MRHTADVIEDIQHTGSKNVFFGDSDFGGKRVRAMELMEAMIPLKVRWSALWTSNLCDDREFMDLAKRSGQLHVNIGFESINTDTLKEMNKKFNKVSRYSEVLGNLRKRGISYSLNFIFGWDNETRAVFSSTLDFLTRDWPWPGHTCHIKPTYCSPEDIVKNVQAMYREFYSRKSMITRLPWPITQANIASWVVNFSQRKMAHISDRDNSNFDAF